MAEKDIAISQGGNCRTEDISTFGGQKTQRQYLPQLSSHCRETLLAGLVTRVVLQIYSPASTDQRLQKTAILLRMGVQAAHGPARSSESRCYTVLSLPVPLWCTVGNTEIKCRSEVDDEALSAGGRFRSLEYTPLPYSQTSCIREITHLPAHPPAPHTAEEPF